MSMKSIVGSCACGSSTYASNSSTPPEHLDFCYCTMCQQVSGAPFMAWMGIPKASLSLSGPISEFSLSSVAKRTFCAKCGSNLTLQYDCYPEKTHLAITTVTHSDWELPKKPGVHIFVRSCPQWYGIPDDGVEKFDQFDKEFEANFPEVVKVLGRR